MSGIIVDGSKATERVKPPSRKAVGTFIARLHARLLSKDQFIEKHASGTLRKNARLGMHATKQYLHERVVFEFGWCFEAITETRVTWGQAITEGDCQSVTEAGWFIDRYAEVCLFPGDAMEAKYITVSYDDGTTKEGLGIVIRKTSAPFVPDGYMVFAIIAEFDPHKKAWKPAVNPC